MNRYSMIVQGSDEDQLFFVTPTGARLKTLICLKDYYNEPPPPNKYST